MPVQRVQVASAAEAPRPGSHKSFKFAGEGDDEVQVLVTNIDGKLYANSPKCTHYGAPLASGVLNGGKVICPWHGACFDLLDGGSVDAGPALDALLKFPVEKDEDGNVFVEADPEKLKGKPGVAAECSKKVQSKKGKNGGTVIIGGGSAAINCAESARLSGYDGPITIYTAEKHAPIDRTKLSKGLVADAGAVTWRPASHLRNVLNVDLQEGVKAVSIDVEGGKVTLSNDETVEYENLVLASGGTPKRLPLPGAKEGELSNVFTLRGVGDTSAILAACGDKQDKEVVVIGTSFIGMEVAIALAGQKKAKSVSVVGMEDFPFQNVLGKEVGEGLMKAQEKSNGLKFYTKAGVEKLEGENGQVSSVVIKDGSDKQVTLPAQVVVLGVGVGPATEYIKSSKGFPDLLKDGSIAVDKDLRVKGLGSGSSNIFACGDIATVPARDAGNETVRIEHWNVAANHGRAVGKTIAGDPRAKPFDHLPIFWSALGSQLRYVSDGNPPGFDDVYIDGNPQELKFAAYYAKKGKVTAVASMGVDPLVMHSSVLIAEGKMPSLADIKGGKDPLSVPLGNASL